MNPPGTPEDECDAWVYDQSEYYSTIVSKVSFLYLKYVPRQTVWRVV